MLRQRRGHGEGMLFGHQPPGEAWMGMQNTPIPLDMIFVAPNGRIVDIIRDARPFSMETIGTHEIVSGVLEVRAGTVDRLGIALGDRGRHSTIGGGGEGPGDRRFSAGGGSGTMRPTKMPPGTAR